MPPEVIDNQCWVRIPNGPETVYAVKMASRNAYDMHRDVYDLHRKFGSEMAAESSRKIDGENPSLSGISHASRAFSLLLAGGALANDLKLTALQ